MNTIKLSTFPERNILLKKDLKENEQFFINISDEEGKPQFQWVGTIKNLMYELRITDY